MAGTLPSSKLSSKKILIFDLDGTLAPSKSPLEKGMARALARLLESRGVAVIGGGSFKQFESQFLANLKIPKKLFKNLYLFPTSGSAFYKYKNGWKRVYEHRLKASEVKRIFKAFSRVFQDINYRKPKKIYGQTIENRGTQISFSALGQKAPLRLKEGWNKSQDIRPLIMKGLARLLPKFEIRRGGLTTIDVTHKGIDKAYGVRKIRTHLKTPIGKMVFVGDALYPGGNDYAAKKTGIDCIQVAGPKQTKKLINSIISKN